MSTIQVAKLGMGYQSASQRPSCKNCKHGDERREDRMPPYDTRTWRCFKGGFITTAMSVCREHGPKRSRPGESI